MLIADPWGAAAALLKIIGLNLLLSGDNALVIAMVMRGLPARERRRGIMIGTLGAVVMRLGLTLGAWRLLEVPGLRLAGGLTLLWMGWRLAVKHDSDAHGAAPTTLLASAIRQVIWADAVMSADNVLAVAAAAHGNLTLLLLGIATSLPLVAVGSGLLGRLLDRFPWLVAVGAALLGWVGGELINADILLDQWPELLQDSLAPVAALLLLWVGWRAQRQPPTAGGDPPDSASAAQDPL
jgi:YjbE family integral membrane protein